MSLGRLVLRVSMRLSLSRFNTEYSSPAASCIIGPGRSYTNLARPRVVTHTSRTSCRGLVSGRFKVASCTLSICTLTTVASDPNNARYPSPKGSISRLPWVLWKLHQTAFDQESANLTAATLNRMAMSPNKTYFLVPNHDFSAEGPLVLGSIISDPVDPGNILNEDDAVEIPLNIKKCSTHMYGWQHTVELMRDGRVSVWGRFVNYWLGGTLGASFDTKTINQYSIEHLETTSFTPSPDYVKEAVDRDLVQDFLEGCQYRLPLYMVTGLKIGRGPNSQVTIRRTAGREVHTNVGVTNPITGAPIAFDSGDMNLRQTKIEDTSFEGSSDFLIGYRLSKITLRKISAQEFTPKQEKFTEGAMLGGHMCTGDDAIQSDSSITIEGEEAVATDFAASASTPAVDEDDNADCQCVVVPLTK